jgi:hypothetical protein
MKPLIERITKGPAAVLDCYTAALHNEAFPREELVWEVQCIDAGNTPAYATSEDDAEFIAEAFTVAHETGMTPRQMAERIAQLERMLAIRQEDAAMQDFEAQFAESRPATFSADPDALHLGPEDRRYRMPEGLPPLPPGTRYAGQLKDHEGRVEGWVTEPGCPGWAYASTWQGSPGDETEDWHVAVPI